jgi:hypothetical protein
MLPISLSFGFLLVSAALGVVVLGVAHAFCPFKCIVRISLKLSLGARVEPALQFLNVEF